MDAPNPGLRERKKQQTRDEISAVATRMFADRGFDQVTIAEVAEAAGVAKMTVTNHFPLKEDLVFDRHDHMVNGVADAIRTRSTGEPALACAHRYYKESLTVGDTTLGHLGIGFARLVEASPALTARERQIHDQRESALAAVLVAEKGAESAGQSSPLTADLTARVVAAQIASAFRVLYYEGRRCLLADKQGPELAAALSELADGVFGLLRADLGDFGAARPAR